MHKRLLASLFTAVVTAVFFVGHLPAMNTKALTFTPNATIQSEAAVLLNLDIGKIVYEKNADKKEMPGSLSQIMTAVLVLENCEDLTKETVTAPEEMYDVFAQTEYPEDVRYADISAGDTLTVEELMYAMMLTSSVEAAYMLANHFGGGSQEKFTEMMNEKAAELGMEDTRYTNTTGLYSARQLTTAHDMMTLLNYAMTLPRFETISCTNFYKAPSAAKNDKGDSWNWKHSNLMVDELSDNYCEGVRGIKTGNTQEGGRCLACKGSRDGHNYLLVTLNAPMKDLEGNNRFYHLEDAKNILDWAFMHLNFMEILSANKELGEVRVNNALEQDFVVVKPAEGYSCMWCDTTDYKSVQQIANWPEEIEAPIHEGDKLGTVVLKLSGETLAEIDVVAAADIERSFWKYNLSEIPGFFRSKYLKNTWVLGIWLSVLYIGACLFFAFRYHEERKQRAAARAGHLKNQSKK